MTVTAWQARQGLLDVRDLAQRELADALRFIGAMPPDKRRDALMDILPALVDRYGSAAVALAADWYVDARLAAEVRGLFDPVLAPVPTARRYASLLEKVAPMPWDSAEALILAGIGRTVADMHRLTIVNSAIADPAASGWMRVGVGATCDFCRVLIGRGAVYSDATVTFKSHDNCKCVAAPAWAPGRRVPTVAYQASKRNVSPSVKRANNRRMYEWIKANA